MSRFIRTLCIATAGLSLQWGQAQAQAPVPFDAAKPIRVIVPFSAGSGSDAMTRQVVNHMAGTLKATIIIDNKTGANGLIGAQAGAQAAPDGTTLFLGTISTHSANPYLIKKLPYDAVNSFTPIGLIGFTAPVLMTNAGNPAKTIADVIALARKDPGGVSFASPNNSSRFATEMLGQQAGVKINLVRYSSPPQAHTDVASGHLSFIFGDFTAGSPHLQSGRLRAIAVAAPRRLAGHPDVPTVAEQGLPGVEVQIWIGLFAPAGLPAPMVNRLNEALNLALNDSEVKAALVQFGAMTAQPGSPAEFKRYLEGQSAHWGAMVKVLKVEAE